MLLLSSHGLESPIVRQKLRGCISDDMKVLVVPFAKQPLGRNISIEYSYGLLPFGFNFENISVLSESKNPDFLNANIVYVPGGNVFRLLKHIKEYQFTDTVCGVETTVGLIDFIKRHVNSGGIYIGCSAGADILSENVEYLSSIEENNVGLIDYTSLNIISDKNIVCHAEQRDYGTLEQLRGYGKKLLMINNDDVVRIDLLDNTEKMLYL